MPGQKPERRQPLRKCVGCNEMKPKKELIRAVKSPQGEVALDRTGKAPGRGAYLCPDAACLRKAHKAHRLERAFSCRIPDEIYQQLEEGLLTDA
ncbi:MAG: YlxR family protein [Oscillospiraceae bacterium]|jgi:predicted RNA-binding protein YlxR (DUF448 family)|nr:YlxR family protein [Oscillospiraceae bacterium]